MFKYMYKYLKNILFSFILVLLMTGTAMASSTDLSIRLSQPKSPTNQDTFGITFVSLDILDRPITVRCFKKGPSDGAFSQFGGDITVSAGGNTGNCDVNSSILNTAGTYQFYATATAGSDTATSTTDTVDFNTSGPGTPSDFSKDKSSCTYTIKYKTADDGGKTVKVELYRSSDNVFTADSGSRVDTHFVGSNTTDTFTNIVPDCNKDYFFVLRAFDSFGNGSGLVGDSSVTVTTGTTTTTTGVTPAEGGAIAAGNQAGNVISKETITPTEEKVTPSSEEQKTGEKEVKGASEVNIWNKLNELLSSKKVQLGLGLVAIFAVLFFLYKTGKLKKFIK